MKYSLNRDKQTNILTIPNKQRMELSCSKKISALVKWIASKHVGGFCLNWLDPFTTKNNIVSHKKLCENKNLSGLVMPFDGNKMLEFNQYQKSDKTSFIIYANLESLIKKVDENKNNPRK